MLAGIQQDNYIQENAPDDQVFNELKVQQPDLGLCVEELRKAIDGSEFNNHDDLAGVLEETMRNMQLTSISVGAGLNNFARYVTRKMTVACIDVDSDFKDTRIYVGLDGKNLDFSKPHFQRRMKEFALMTTWARGVIGELSGPFIDTCDIILVHGFSKAVLEVLKKNKENSIKVLCTDGSPYHNGKEFQIKLEEHGISANVLDDMAVANALSASVSKVLVGADIVDTDGGIIGQLGTYQISILAKHLQVPVFVAAESFKFCKPIPEKTEYDYTPPGYLNIIISDSGVLFPSQISRVWPQLYIGRRFPLLPT